MATDTQTSNLRMVRAVDGLDLTLEPLQGLWSVEQYLKLTNQTCSSFGMPKTHAIRIRIGLALIW
jgi:hypothetical protein